MKHTLGDGLDEVRSLLDDLATDGRVDRVHPGAQGDALLLGQRLGAVRVHDEIVASGEQDLAQATGATLALLLVDLCECVACLRLSLS